MDLSKHLEFFNPQKFPTIHIIGCGAIGSTVAEMLTRLGTPKLVLYDFDTVSKHNITNQMFFADQIGKHKVVCLADTLARINPDINVAVCPNGYNVDKPQRLYGYVVLCVDNIELRHKIIEQNLQNNSIKAMFDFRMRLTDAQHYAADWSVEKDKESLLKSTEFTHEEATAATPVSACGTTLSVAPTVRTIVSMGVANMINFTKNNQLKKLILIDAFEHQITAM